MSRRGGFPSTKFCSSARSEFFHCLICLDVCRSPVTCRSGDHLFCHGCLAESLRHNPSCPTCREPLADPVPCPFALKKSVCSRYALLARRMHMEKERVVDWTAILIRIAHTSPSSVLEKEAAEHAFRARRWCRISSLPVFKTVQTPKPKHKEAMESSQKSSENALSSQKALKSPDKEAMESSQKALKSPEKEAMESSQKALKRSEKDAMKSSQKKAMKSLIHVIFA